MKKYILIIAGLLCIECLMAQPEAEFHKIHKQYTLNKDGSYTYQMRKELTILSHVALNNLYGETFVIYNPEYQSVEINESYTKQWDGTIITTPENAFNEALPHYAADAPAYNHLKELVITHTGLEIGATIYLDYTLTTKAGFCPSWNIAEILQESSPVADYQMDIIIPKNQKLNYILVGNETQPMIVNESNVNKYSWQLKQMQASSLERNVPRNAIPCLYATIVDSQSALKSIHSLLTINKVAVLEVAKKIKEENPTSVVQSMHNYVLNDLALSNVPLNMAGKVRTPENVIASAYGTLIEKVGFLASLLQAVGIEYEIICVFPAHVRNIFGTHFLSDMVIKVENDYLSLKQTEMKDIALRASRDQFWSIGQSKAIPLLLSEKQASINYIVNISLTDTLAKITGTLWDGEAKEQEKSIAEDIKLQTHYDYLTYALPAPKKGANNWQLFLLNSKRTQSFELPFLTKEEYRYEISWDDYLKLKTKPFDIYLSNEIGAVSLSMQKTAGKIIITRKIEFYRTIIPVNEYNDFRELMLLWHNNDYHTLIFKK